MFYKNTDIIGCTLRISQEKKSCGQKLPLNDVVLCNYSWLESRGRRIGNLKKSFWMAWIFRAQTCYKQIALKTKPKMGFALVWK